MRLKRIAKAAAIVLSGMLLASCYSPIGGISLFRSNRGGDNRYTTGGASLRDTVRSIEVDWDAGQVEISTHSGDTIDFSETANRALDDSTALCYYLEGQTLHIKFAGNDKKFWDNLQKSLTIALPQSLVLENLEVDTASAGVTVQGVSARKVEMETASGSVEISGATVSDECKVETASGSVTAALAGTRKISVETTSGSICLTGTNASDEVDLESTSGAITAQLGVVRELDIQTVSGVINATAESASQVDAESTSGRVTLTLGAMPSKCDIETINGAVELTLPWSAALNARVKTISGSVASDFSLEKNGLTYTAGSGNRPEVEIETVSGSVLLHASAR